MGRGSGCARWSKQRGGGSENKRERGEKGPTTHGPTAHFQHHQHAANNKPTAHANPVAARGHPPSPSPPPLPPPSSFRHTRPLPPCCARPAPPTHSCARPAPPVLLHATSTLPHPPLHTATPSLPLHEANTPCCTEANTPCCEHPAARKPNTLQHGKHPAACQKH